MAYRARVLGRISELEAELWAMRRAHNEASLMLRLPPELFTRVFKELTILSPHGISPIRRHRKTPRQKEAPWLSQVNVCHRWRQIILSCSSLWSSLLLTREDLTREMITRSGVAPLEVNLAEGYKYIPGALRVALAQVQRLQSVSLYAPFGTAKWPEDVLDHWTHQELPILKNLSLENSEPHYSRPTAFKSFPQKAPSLRCLVMRGLTISWNEMPLGSNIVNLRLSQKRRSLARPSWTDFFTSLRAMSRLETLDLEGFLPMGQLNSLEMTGSPLRPELPRLKSLRIADFMEPTSDFFKSVSYPTTALIDADIVGQGDEESDMEGSDIGESDLAALNSFDFLFGNFNHPAFKQLRIETNPGYYWYHKLKFSFWTNVAEDLGSNRKVSQENPARSIEVKLHNKFEISSDHVISVALKNYDLEPIESMILSIEEGEPAPDWAALSSSMSGTRSISCYEVAMVPFLQALAGSSTSSTITDIEERSTCSGRPLHMPASHPALFTSLDTLIISEPAFGSRYGRRDDVGYEHEMSLLLEALGNRNAVLPIPTIVLRCCHTLEKRDRERVESAAKGSTVQWIEYY